MNARSFLLPVSTLILGAALGYAGGRGTVAPASNQDELLRLVREQGAQLQALKADGSRSPPTGNCVFAVPANAVDASALRAEIAKVLREELQRGAGTGAEAPKAPPKEPEPTPENNQAKELAFRMVEKAASSRRWTQEDAMEYRLLMTKVTDAQRMEMSQKLIVLLNAGGISVETHGPPF